MSDSATWVHYTSCMALDIEAVLRHATALQRVTSLRGLMQVTHDAVVQGTRYQHAWLGLVRPDDPLHLVVLQVAGAVEELVLERCPKVLIAGDAMVADILANRIPVVVVEAATDPRTNKAIVAALGNRTIVNVPMLLGADVLGSLGVGTFGDEGPLAPTDDELEYLVVLATQLAGAYSRWCMLEEQDREQERRAALERQLARLQRVEMMGVMTAGVAHDLNNYLMVARLELEAFRDGEIDTLDAASSVVEKSIAVVQQLLTLGRKQEGNTSSMNLSERVRGSLQLLRPAIPRCINVATRLDPPMHVMADAVQVEQAIANLVLNARDAIAGVGRIDVELDTITLDDDPGRRFARLAVRDSGQGIAPEQRERIFEPLYTTKSNGTGLGLAVVARVAEQHGGLVTCESTVGVGSTFCLLLPQ